MERTEEREDGKREAPMEKNRDRRKEGRTEDTKIEE